MAVLVGHWKGSLSLSQKLYVNKINELVFTLMSFKFVQYLYLEIWEPEFVLL